jgi:hypothetical protein
VFGQLANHAPAHEGFSPKPPHSHYLGALRRAVLLSHVVSHKQLATFTVPAAGQSPTLALQEIHNCEQKRDLNLCRPASRPSNRPTAPAIRLIGARGYYGPVPQNTIEIVSDFNAPGFTVNKAFDSLAHRTSKRPELVRW